jgi:hypothetical protein
LGGSQAVIVYNDITQTNVHDLAEHLLRDDVITEANNVYRILVAADGIANTAIWLIVPMTYTRNIHLDVRELTHTDFKTDAEGQYGGSLNMVLIYLEYFAANIPVADINTNRARDLGADEPVSAMRGIDNYFCAIVEAKLELRVFSRHLYRNDSNMLASTVP